MTYDSIYMKHKISKIIYGLRGMGLTPGDMMMERDTGTFWDTGHGVY